MAKWGKHVFNLNHPAYTATLWEELVKCVKHVKDGFKGELTGMDRHMIKRLVYHHMFLEETKGSFETIAYNDSEYLDDYESYNGCFAKFVNSDIAQASGLSFNDFISLPNHIADWILEYGNKRTINSTNDSNSAMEDLNAELERAKKEMTGGSSKNKHDPFRSPY